MAAGIDLFSKFSDQTQYARYENRMTGGQLRLGLPVTEEFGSRLRYSLYQQDLDDPERRRAAVQRLLGPDPRLYACSTPNGTPNRAFCEGNGEASLAIKEAQGETLTSLAGLTFNYNTLDNIKDPRNGFYAEVKTDFAGLGGDSQLLPRHRRCPLLSRAVRGHRRYRPRPGRPYHGLRKRNDGGDGDLRIVDHFFLGPSLVRGFAPPASARATSRASTANANAIGGTTYFGGSLEVQFPICGLPRELGLKGAVFADAGTLFGYKGPTTFDINGNGIIDGFAPTGCTLSPSRAAGMHPRARQQDDPLVGRRLHPLDARRSARSASTTPSP